LPWAVRPHLPDAHFEVVADTFGNTVGTATRPDDAALIVEAVNGRDRLRELVRRMIPSVEAALALSEAEGEALDRWLTLLREAREALGESMKEGAR
jgi:hypothetical protein